MELTQKKSIGLIIGDVIFLIVFNIVLMCIIGFMTLDSRANNNSRLGAFLLSFFIPIFLVFLSRKMNGLERMIKFGTGFIVYLILGFISLRLPDFIFTGLLPCLIISLGILFYGNYFIKIKEHYEIWLKVIKRWYLQKQDCTMNHLQFTISIGSGLTCFAINKMFISFCNSNYLRNGMNIIISTCSNNWTPLGASWQFFKTKVIRNGYWYF